MAAGVEARPLRGGPGSRHRGLSERVLRQFRDATAEQTAPDVLARCVRTGAAAVGPVVALQCLAGRSDRHGLSGSPVLDQLFASVVLE